MPESKNTTCIVCSGMFAESDRRLLCSSCAKSRELARTRAWRAKNKQHVKEYAKRYRDGNESYAANKKVSDRKYHHEVRKNNPDAIKRQRETSKIWDSRNPGKVADKIRRYKEKHRESINVRQSAVYQALSSEERKAVYQKRAEYLREYRQKNRAALTEKATAKRRADFAADPEFYKKIYRSNRERFIQQANKRQRLVKDRGVFTAEDIDALFEKQSAMCAYCECDISKAFEIDHVMPISLGGMNTADNLALACRPCNRKKHNKHPDAWAEELKKRKCAA